MKNGFRCFLYYYLWFIYHLAKEQKEEKPLWLVYEANTQIAAADMVGMAATFSFAILVFVFIALIGTNALTS